MNFRITILCENSVGAVSGTLGEHGFSALIEPAGGEAVLFDTGAGLTLLHNACRMNKNLEKVSKVVISHGHYDHGGGLMPLLKQCGPKQVYAHPDIFKARYRIKDSGECYPIGIPDQKSDLETAGAFFDLSIEYREIAPGVWLTGQVPRVTEFETGDQGLFCDNSGLELDSTPDDQSLILETAKGLVIILGCCHAGMVNTLQHIACMTGRSDIHAVLGGTHLGFCAPEQLENTISAIRKSGIQKLAVSHCTGFAASLRLSRELQKSFQVAMVGYTIEV